MDLRQLNPQKEGPVELPIRHKPQKTELINGKSIPVGTLDEFALAVYGKPLEKKTDGSLILHQGLILGIEKFKVASGKFYRLIWVAGDTAWLAEENTTRFTAKMLAWAAGYELAAQTGAFFDESTR